MAGYEYKKEKPFSEVYFTGIVRDKIGRKMSKQLGNSPDLLEMIDNDGADAVRFALGARKHRWRSPPSREERAWITSRDQAE